MNRSNILSLPQENSLESILLDPSLGTVSTQTRKSSWSGKGRSEWANEGARLYGDGNRMGNMAEQEGSGWERKPVCSDTTMALRFWMFYFTF